MALIQAVLMYRPTGYRDTEGLVPLGATDDVNVLRLLRDTLLANAFADAKMWTDVDAGLVLLKTLEAQRLEKVLAVLLPDAELRPGLRLVNPLEPYHE